MYVKTFRFKNHDLAFSAFKGDKYKSIKVGTIQDNIVNKYIAALSRQGATNYTMTYDDSDDIITYKITFPNEDLNTIKIKMRVAKNEIFSKPHNN